MDKTSRTPGPWIIRTLENFGWNIVHYRDGNNFDFIRVAKAGNEANARLIAAAPDLLESLKDFVDECEGSATEGVMERAKKAIAKAEGRCNG